MLSSYFIDIVSKLPMLSPLLPIHRRKAGMASFMVYDRANDIRQVQEFDKLWSEWGT